MTATATPTAVERPKERAKPRNAGTSVIGHGVGLGGNGLLYAFGSYGWGVAAAVAGVFGLAGAARAVRGRRRGSRGLFGGGRGGGLSRLLPGGGRRGGVGGSRGGSGSRGGGRGTSSGSRSGGASGASKNSPLKKLGGFLKKAAAGRSLSPKRGGGIPGSGSSPTRSRNPVSKGKSGGRSRGVPGTGRGSGATPGSKRGRSGGSIPGGGRGSGKKGKGFGGDGAGGTGKGSGSKGKGGKLRGLTKHLNPRNWGKGSPDKTKPKKKPKGDKPKETKAKQNDQITDPSGWVKAPTRKPKSKMERQDPNMFGKTTGSAPAAPKGGHPPMPGSSGGGGRGGGGARYSGGITAAAEGMAAALAKPGVEGDKLKNQDRILSDVANGMEVLQGGFKNRAAAYEDEMPDETAGHEQFRQLERLMGQVAEAAAALQADQHRRNAADHERTGDGARKNERGYDYTENQD